MSDIAEGGARLTVKLSQKRMAGWLFRLPPNATKTFEFDPLGKFVWDYCDGDTTVQQIARKLARAYRISEREAQVATEKFLTLLAKKGLVGAAITRKTAATDGKMKARKT